MEYRHLGRTGLQVSELTLGCLTFGRETDESEARKIVDRYLELGGNVLDTADTYGRGASEEITGRLVKGRRHLVVLATKVRFHPNAISGGVVGPNQMGLSRRHIMAAVEASLRRLQTDYIDVYQAHSWDFDTPIEETLHTFDDLVRQGKVRYIGASNFTAGQLMKSLWVSDKHGYERIESLQPCYSLVAREIDREILPICQEEHIGVIPWGPLGGGFLTGKYRTDQPPPPDARLTRQDLWGRLTVDRNYRTLATVEQIARKLDRSIAEVALAWVIQQPGISSVIYGARNAEQNEQNLRAVGLRLAAEDLELLDRVSALAPEYPASMQTRHERR